MPKNEIHKLARKARQIIDVADDENRDLYPEESREVSSLLDQVQALKATDTGAAEFAKGFGNAGPVSADGDIAAGPLGSAFVRSKAYQKIKDPRSRAQTWASDPIEVPLAAKGTLTTTTGGGSGGGLVPPHYEPGVVSQLFEPIGIEPLFGASVIDTGQVRYVNEGTADSGAAGVAEGGVKPESELAYSEVTEPVKKIATVLPVSDELLEDASSIESYLNERLSLFTRLETERQLLRGTGTDELVGVMDAVRGISTYARGTVDNNAVALLKAAAGVRGSANVEPDSVVLHPSNWLTTRLLADSAGQFLGGGPWQGQYGNANQVSSSQFSSESLWGLKVVTSTIVGSGTALLGNFGQSAHIWNRGGIRVDATNSHDTYFVRNLSMIRAERRLALGVFRPQAFVQVTGLS